LCDANCASFNEKYTVVSEI